MPTLPTTTKYHVCAPGHPRHDTPSHQPAQPNPLHRRRARNPTHPHSHHTRRRYGDLQLLGADEQGNFGEVYYGRALKGVHLGEPAIAKKCPVNVFFELLNSDIARLRR